MTYKIFLASQSPRRRALLSELFNNIVYIDSALEEPIWSKTQSAQLYLESCVATKWQGALLGLEQSSTQLASGTALLVADTIVVLGGKVLGKPASAAEAKQMLLKLSGKTHQVWTAFKLGRFDMGAWNSKQEVVKTHVSFHKLSNKEISDYVKTKEPLDKAGSYGFQDRALKFVSKIEGSYLNVVGLPLKDVANAAASLGLELK